MRLLALLFDTRGRLARWPFCAGLVGALAAFWLGIQASLAALPWMAEVLAPRGINAAFALNTIWLALGILLVWVMTALFAKRLRARGRSPWWALAAVVPPAVLALLNDAIFLLSRHVALPGFLNATLIAGAIALSGGVLVACLRADEDSASLRR